jgi:hypothetical protein
MPEKTKDREVNPYLRDFENMAPKVGTSSFQRNMAEELANINQANRIQRQTVSASYAEQYQQARGNMMRQQMAGTTPGLTGGLAEQRNSEISGAQMRALSQLSGQREQALREVDYQGLMANRQAFDFAQQRAMAGRDEQMFNLQMINSRQSIIESKMSDEDKIQSLLNTGLTLEEARAEVEETGSWWKEFTKKAGTGAVGVGAAGAGLTALSAPTIAKFALPTAAKTAIKGVLTKAGLAKAGAALTFKTAIGAAVPIIGVAMLIGGAGFALYNYYKNK